jgi:hypothetical protein
MCMADGSDRADVWLEWKPRARKEHKCDECSRPIAKGETYRQTKALYEGSWLALKQCAHCVVLADWLVAECGGYLTQGIVEDFGEHAQEYGRFDLTRLRWGAENQWQRKGALLPIPRMPPTSERRAQL